MQRLTIVIPTFNRATVLARALAAATAQARQAPLAIVVVDNNSTDGTPAVVRGFASDPRVHYVREPRQGLSYARNAGIAAADRIHAGAADSLVAFTDDDVEVAPDWAEVILREFLTHRGVDCVGGRVLPRWPADPPPWLTPNHWAPLALQDHGAEPRVFDRDQPLCLVGANVAFRRSVFDRVGLFSPDVQRVEDGIGSTEDHELLLRLYAAGGRARYVPELVVSTEVPAERLTPAYHRRWHLGHGRFHALMRTPDLEASRRRLLGVPAHLFRSAAQDAAAWARHRIAGERVDAFAAETRLWFFTGFVRERCACLRR